MRLFQDIFVFYCSLLLSFSRSNASNSKIWPIDLWECSFFGSDNQRRYVYASQANTHTYNIILLLAMQLSSIIHYVVLHHSYVYYVIHKSYTNVDNTKVQWKKKARDPSLNWNHGIKFFCSEFNLNWSDFSKTKI